MYRILVEDTLSIFCREWNTMRFSVESKSWRYCKWIKLRPGRNEFANFWLSGKAFDSGAQVKGSNLGPVKSDTVSPTVRHRCDISSKKAVLLGRNNAKMDPQTRYALRCNIASIMIDLILIWLFQSLNNHKSVTKNFINKLAMWLKSHASVNMTSCSKNIHILLLCIQSLVLQKNW